MLFVLGLFDLSYGEKINNAVYDSLLIKLKLIKEDSNKVDFVLSETLNKFHNHYGIQIIERVLPLALDNKNLERAIICYLRMGAIENARSRPNDAIKYYFNGVRICGDETYKKERGEFYAQLSQSFLNVGELKNARIYLDSATSIFNNVNYKEKLAYAMTLYAMIENSAGSSNSIDYYKKAYVLYEQLNDREAMLKLSITVAYISDLLEHYTEALEFYLRADQIVDKEKNIVDAFTIAAGLESTYKQLNNINKSNQYKLLLDSLITSSNDSELKAEGLLYIGRNYFNKENIDRALDCLVGARRLCLMYNLKSTLKEVDLHLYKIYEENGELEKAFKYYKSYNAVKDSIFDLEKANQIFELQERFDSEKREEAIVVLKNERNYEKKIKNVLSIAVVAFIAALILVFNLFRIKRKSTIELTKKNSQIEKQSALLTKKNDQITDSITYAQRLQQALLPGPHKMKKLLKDYFIYFEPKAIVSGDFYWVQELDDDKILIAVADCTGHGVPGAMMSTMGMNLLDRIINQQTTLNPAEILTALSIEVEKKLSDDVKRTMKDGMDISVLLFCKKSKKMKFAGAYNSIYHVSAGKLKEIEAQRVPIGQTALLDEEPYTEIEINLSDGDMIYLFTDGYVDQRGGAHNKKFYYKPFRELFENIAEKPMNYQCNYLKKTFTDWKGEHEQIDDICILGIKV